ncbi:hypothetical protein C8J57DRAFT_1458404 [Mycena rebaudengoi]|nr:hypothetical protein C8J57DRAFT_1458404 [Mycena rebaudengoi]
MSTTVKSRILSQYTILAATPAYNMAETAKVALLGSVAALSLSILRCIELENLIQYTTVAASTVEEIAGAFQIPFLTSATALTLSILQIVEAVRSNRDEWISMVLAPRLEEDKFSVNSGTFCMR